MDLKLLNEIRPEKNTSKESFRVDLHFSEQWSDGDDGALLHGMKSINSIRLDGSLMLSTQPVEAIFRSILDPCSLLRELRITRVRNEDILDKLALHLPDHKSLKVLEISDTLADIGHG